MLGFSVMSWQFCSWSDFQSSSIAEVHVFKMFTHSETTHTQKTAQVFKIRKKGFISIMFVCIPAKNNPVYMLSAWTINCTLFSCYSLLEILVMLALDIYWTSLLVIMHSYVPYSCLFMFCTKAKCRSWAGPERIRGFLFFFSVWKLKSKQTQIFNGLQCKFN